MRLGKKKLYEASILNSKKTSIGFKPEETKQRILNEYKRILGSRRHLEVRM